MDSNDHLTEKTWLCGWPVVDEVGEMPWAERYDEALGRPAIERLAEMQGAARYDPFDGEHTALFLDFAEIAEVQGEAFQARCLEFARDSGLLGVREDLPSLILDSERGLYHRSGESLATWKTAAELLHLAARLWQADNDADLGDKARARSWVTSWLRGKSDMGPRRAFGHITISTMLTGGAEDSRVPVPRRGQEEVYDREYREALLADLTNAFLSTGLAFGVVRGSRGAHQLQIVPDSLWRFMWYQIGQAQGTSSTFLKCRSCGKWRIHHPDVARGNRRYCDQVCKQLAYEKRKARAVQLHGEDSSRTPEQIVKILEQEEGYRATKSVTVLKWVTGG
ncbi:MAG: hypothetical protein HGA39_05980 [Coriobacteriia bacterium]|nr:hypothetical protein [Coriobacteriia bacterium]